jgi:phosphoglycerate dehydrogenase-like enzyme
VSRIVFLGPPAFAPLQQLRDAGVEFFASDDAAALRSAVADAEILLVAPRSGALLREVFAHARDLRWIHGLAAGVEPLLFDELRESDVPLTNGRGLFADALGEFAIAAMLWFAKDLARMRRNQEAARWEPFGVDWLQGKAVGIVGYGSIGRAVATRAAALGMRIAAMRRSEGSLEDVLRAADYLVISTPLTPETHGLIGAAQLALLKPAAVVINIGRGAVINEAALLDALTERRIRGAALDVFAEEPLPAAHPFWHLGNVLLSPHCADHTPDSHLRAMQFFLENLACYEREEPLANVVDKRAGY